MPWQCKTRQCWRSDILRIHKRRGVTSTRGTRVRVTSAWRSRGISIFLSPVVHRSTEPRHKHAFYCVAKYSSGVSWSRLICLMAVACFNDLNSSSHARGNYIFWRQPSYEAHAFEGGYDEKRQKKRGGNKTAKEKGSFSVERRLVDAENTLVGRSRSFSFCSGNTIGGDY